MELIYPHSFHEHLEFSNLPLHLDYLEGLPNTMTVFYTSSLFPELCFMTELPSPISSTQTDTCSSTLPVSGTCDAE